MPSADDIMRPCKYPSSCEMTRLEVTIPGVSSFYHGFGPMLNTFISLWWNDTSNFALYWAVIFPIELLVLAGCFFNVLPVDWF